MLSVSFRLTVDARADVQAIWRYTVSAWGEKQAEIYLGRIAEACVKLNQNSNLGKLLPQLSPDIRCFRCEHHFIFYLEDRGGVIFIAFLHERMDIVSRLIHRLEQP
ncbi:MAG: type II toxin-antitoxin system RelE/ParE family toxin [Alphaproteobacteria bacterium]|nr:type II toxin-antitoxin system RelE/ParE family toxin [Alphaproteobacteria bacterium]